MSVACNVIARRTKSRRCRSPLTHAHRRIDSCSAARGQAIGPADGASSVPQQLMRRTFVDSTRASLGDGYASPHSMAGQDETDDPVLPKQDTLKKLTETLQRETDELQRLEDAADRRNQKPPAHPGPARSTNNEAQRYVEHLRSHRS